MDATAIQTRLAESFVAHLATVGEDGRPHIVPMTFAMDGDVLYFAVDGKPKRTTDLKRLRNIAANPAVSVLVDHYEEDWTRLWWVRVDGTARVLPPGHESDHAIALLVGRHSQYASRPPGGPVVAITIETLHGWSAS